MYRQEIKVVSASILQQTMVDVEDLGEVKRQLYFFTEGSVYGYFSMVQ
jgi:hypothetical protein